MFSWYLNWLPFSRVTIPCSFGFGTSFFRASKRSLIICPWKIPSGVVEYIWTTRNTDKAQHWASWRSRRRRSRLSLHLYHLHHWSNLQTYGLEDSAISKTLLQMFQVINVERTLQVFNHWAYIVLIYCIPHKVFHIFDMDVLLTGKSGKECADKDNAELLCVCLPCRALTGAQLGNSYCRVPTTVELSSIISGRNRSRNPGWRRSEEIQFCQIRYAQQILLQYI